MRTALKELQTRFEGYQSMLGPRSSLDDSFAKIRETEKVIANPAYQRGVKYLISKGAQLERVVGIVKPATIMDQSVLDAALAHIPTDLLGHFSLTAQDIEKPSEQNYARPRLVEIAKTFEAKSERLTYRQLAQLLDAEDAEQGSLKTLLDIETGTKGAFKATDVLYDFTYRQIPLSVLQNTEFITGLKELGTAGISRYHALSFNDGPTAMQRIVELVADPDFRKAYIAMKGFGVEINIDYLTRWKREMYTHPNFISNLEVVKQYSAFSFGSFEYNQNAIVADRLGEFLAFVPKDKMWNAASFIEKVSTNPTHWNAAIELAKKYKDNAPILSALFELTGPKMLDQDYLRLLDAHATERGATMNERGPGTSGLISAINLDERYLQEKTGLGIRAIALDLNTFLRVYNDPSATEVTKDILDKFKQFALTSIVLKMNELHDSSAATRLNVIASYDAKLLFDIMVTGGSDAFLSTFRLLYNGNGAQEELLKNTFKTKVIQEYGSLYDFFLKANPQKRDVTRFFEHLSQNDLTDAFLVDLGSEQRQHEILEKYVFDITQQLSEGEAVAVDDLLAATKNVQVHTFIMDSFKKVLDGSIEVSPKSRNIAGVLVASFYRVSSSVPDWATKSVQEYGQYFPETKFYDTSSAFREIAGVMTNIQAHFFYDDRAAGKPESTWDGHNSFKNFIGSLGGSVQWSTSGAIQRITVGQNVALEDKGDFIILRKRDARAKREIVIYVNKPDRADAVVETTMTKIMEEQKPQTVVHRGHSYHASKTIKLLRPSVTMVNLGSCGGAKNISEVLGKAPSAQVMATRNVGTMLVNDPLIRAIDSSLLAQGQIDWGAMRTQMTGIFARSGGSANERWQSYQLPNQNRTAHLLAALKRVAEKR